jgi:hypothetical protein
MEHSRGFSWLCDADVLLKASRLVGTHGVAMPFSLIRLAHDPVAEAGGMSSCPAPVQPQSAIDADMVDHTNGCGLDLCNVRTCRRRAGAASTGLTLWIFEWKEKSP